MCVYKCCRILLYSTSHISSHHWETCDALHLKKKCFRYFFQIVLASLSPSFDVLKQSWNVNGARRRK